MENNYLTHYGIKGQRWGVRRFQNKDGSLTPRGNKKQQRKELSKMNKSHKRSLKSAILTGEDYAHARARQSIKIRRAQKYMEKKNMSAADALKLSQKKETQQFMAYVAGLAIVNGAIIFKATRG